MTPKRPKELKWIGDRYPDGRPARFLAFVPDRDLDEAETDALTQEQLADIRASDLYREVHEKAMPSKKASTKQPEAAGAAKPSEAGEEPGTTAEPVTESEG